MRTIETWSALSNTDLNEGRGSTIVVARFNAKDVAEKVVRDKRYSRYCVMGYHNADECVRNNIRRELINIYDSAEDFWENTIEERRKKAMAKLTAADMEALGIKV